MERPDLKLAKRLAEELVGKYGFEYPIVNVFAIAEGEGLSLKEFDPSGNETLKKTAGFLDPKAKTIFLNKNDAPQRKIFTIAHELGHFMLKHDPNEYGILPRWQLPGVKPGWIEKEADVFAVHLLVPSFMLKEILRTYNIPPSLSSVLAGLFGVSEEVMRYRLSLVAASKPAWRRGFGLRARASYP